MFVVETLPDPYNVMTEFDFMSKIARRAVIAHRGASGYAPEHTLEAYRLAIAQKADYVEQDLQITRDGVLVCLHDLTLERTTNVAEVFPGRAVSDGSAQHWYVWDFSLAEIKTLDAGEWFDAQFRGARIPTWQEAVNTVRGKAGLYPEVKDAEAYAGRGFDMEKILVDSLEKNGLNEPLSSASTPVIIQSFNPDSLRRLAHRLKVRVPLVLLLSPETGSDLTAAELKEIREFAQGIGPEKSIVRGDPELVNRAHAAGLSVAAYTFCESDEMALFLDTLGVDAVFTDNPDLVRR